MKTISLVLLMNVLSCTTSVTNQQNGEPEPELVCGVKNPIQELSWLKEITDKADQDKTKKLYQGNYLGTIYLEKYNGQSVFVSNMAMGSGGLAARVFYCDGQMVKFQTPQEIEAYFKGIEKRNIVYTNVP